MQGGVEVGFLGDPESLTNPVECEPPHAMGQEATTSLEKCGRGVSGGARGEVSELVDDLIGNCVRRAANRLEQRDDVFDAETRSLRVDRELEQRRARDAETVGFAPLDDTGCLEVGEVRGDHLGQQRFELFKRRRRTRLVDMDELVGLESEHFAELRARAPVTEQVPDPRERIAAITQSVDELQPPEVARAVEADSALAAGRGHDPEGLILPDRANRESDHSGELVDGPFRRRVARRFSDLEM